MDDGSVVLGLESSCDETAAAVLRADGTILAEAVLSQLAEHAPYGGVVPEIAARAHLDHLPRLVAQVMAEAGLGYRDLAGIAVTAGPGLIGGLIVGSSLGKGIALAQGLPFVAVNHLEAHALTATLPGIVPRDVGGGIVPKGMGGGTVPRDAGGDAAAPVRFPYLLLLLSGGHCQCVAVEGVGRYRRLGTTLDDAVGEAFDKSAKLLGLPWPGGPALEQLARLGDPTRIPLPRPLLGRAGCDFSWSGLKTAVAHAVARCAAGAPLGQSVAGASFGQGAAGAPFGQDAGGVPFGQGAGGAPFGQDAAGAPFGQGAGGVSLGQGAGGVPSEQDRADIAAAFQASVAVVLADRARHALDMLPAATALVVAGGVAANQGVRAALAGAAAQRGLALVAPPIRLCTDNAVMVAWAGIERLRLGLVDELGHAPRPRWPLEGMAAIPG